MTLTTVICGDKRHDGPIKNLFNSILSIKFNCFLMFYTVFLDLRYKYVSLNNNFIF